MVILYFLGLVVIFYLLAKVCDEYFVSSLDIITKKLKLSQDVAGATFMAIGSSAPELFTAIIALSKVGAENIGAGTIIGSAIFNILVIVGASAVVSKAFLNWQPVVRDMGFYILSILLLLVTFKDGHITTFEALFYVFGYIVYLLVLSNWKKFVKYKNNEDYLDEVEEDFSKAEEKIEKKKGVLGAILQRVDKVMAITFPDLDKKPNLYLLTFGVSITYIAVLSWALVELAVLSAHALNISEAIIALTILAGGTSIPDLISSLIVAKRGKGAMAISNAVGSNTFDILVGLGLPWLAYTLIKSQDVVVSTENLMSSVFLLFFTVVALLFIMVFQRFKIGKKSGYFLLLFYLLYLGYAIWHAIYPNSVGIEDLLRNFGFHI